MPEYILYDKDGKKYIMSHMIDVRTALATKKYFPERPKPKIEKPVKRKSSKKSKPSVKVKIKKTSEEEIRDKIKIKSDIEKMEDKIKETEL